MGSNTIWEPDAGNPQVRFCGGREGKPSRLPTGDTLGGRLKTSPTLLRAKRVPALAGGPGGPAVLLVRVSKGTESPFGRRGAAGGGPPPSPEQLFKKKYLSKNSTKIRAKPKGGQAQRRASPQTPNVVQ